MPTFTQAQRSSIRFFCGWGTRYANSQNWSVFEGALDRVQNLFPEEFARITNALTGDPPGLLAQLEDIHAKLIRTHGRFKAASVGSITLNPAEAGQLAMQGRRLVNNLCQVIDVRRDRDVFSSGSGGGRGDNYVGKA